ncbi:MAG TPA: hypothetical protein VG204_03655 [Terriglobia bacterium]|nr:hypothetical protein [Terriglobia bacterium]
MAVTRTVLPRKGLIQSQHGLTSYEADQDANWLLLDSRVAFTSDLGLAQAGDLGINGVVSGLALATASGLVPGLTNGILYAQGSRFAPAAAPVLPAAPPNAISYLFYNSTNGFYYQPGAVGATPGDALIGQVVTSGSAVTAVTPATKVYGMVSIAVSAPGNFTVPHLLGRTPLGVIIQMTAAGAMWFQPSMFDGTNLYMVASAPGLTAKVQVW